MRIVHRHTDYNVTGMDKFRKAGTLLSTARSYTAGDGLNANNCGMYALEWRNLTFKTWLFCSDSIPLNLLEGKRLKTMSWPKPIVTFDRSDPYEDHWVPRSIIADRDFCDDLAGRKKEFNKGEVSGHLYGFCKGSSLGVEGCVLGLRSWRDFTAEGKE
ncbi:glycoside hydrolase family 16 protein [Piedraia hortae CBS 480.64]|uniref:Glycoside hydrolase family 16 protein n=1 Tax=Piedraia hortae CBS 480.64 TaxID=1314780 RepID=A0A6A7BVK2_9PEZI|nr:glycoside hydrolase family 16 protein [Piedraia hortae CBS 480.64]